MVIIGITGTLGAGKGTIVEYLIEKHNFMHFSARGFISQELNKRGEKIDRDSLTHLANELRSQFGPAYIIDQLFEQASESGRNCVIESIRTPGEVISLRQKPQFLLLAVDADPKIRFDRIKLRKSETDHIDFDTFLANEKREMDSTDPNKQNLSKCISMADFKISNDGNLAELQQQVEKIILNFN